MEDISISIVDLADQTKDQKLTLKSCRLAGINHNDGSPKPRIHLNILQFFIDVLCSLSLLRTFLYCLK